MKRLRSTHKWLKRWAPRFEHDPHPLARGGSVAICSVSLMHIAQAALLTVAAATANATPMGALIYMASIVGYAIGLPDILRWLPVVMWGAAGIAIIGALLRLGWIRLALFIPQNLILGCMAAGGAIAAIHGSYLDGTVKPWQHITADQCGLWALYIVHCSAILRRAANPNG